MMPRLQVNLGGLSMKNPVTVASGTFGYGQEYDRYFDIGLLGAVTTKSISLHPRAGNRPPRLVETAAGMLNAIGLQNVGLEVYLSEKAPFLRERKTPIIANIYGHSPDEYATLADRLEKEGAADAIEANLSCPNVHDAKGGRGPALVAQDPQRVLLYTQAVRSATRLPLLIKLSPNVTDIREPALAAQEGGADAISLINTLMGMAIDPETRRPRLANIVGGLSGPAIRPVALKMVWDVARTVNISVLGMGGICDVGDAIQFLLAGATAVAIGSMTFRQPNVTVNIINGLSEYLDRHNINSIADVVGAVRTD
ncbi:MAG TPA: dihydroorotate dehydrogenase [Candidatus Hydrogenedentes bacterium]|nr:dihydroorotate dehydrogenase [Candidatus Hydrogenedentota bacterium]HPG69299.1 dihydroorotate dehydrogenase [Candidatus Hydrogenedentota bacterium]